MTGLESFGYTGTEARFLELVVRLGGYFVRRQFNQFAGCQTGKRTQDFIHKLLSRGHARLTVNRHARQVIHVHFKPFYCALNGEDNPNRRAHQPRAIKARLMILDYALANSDSVLLTTEVEKTAFLKNRFEINSQTLSPGLAKLVISTPKDDAACVSLVFIDESSAMLSAFESCLRRALPVFEELAKFDLVYVAAQSRHFENAEAVFRRIVLSLGGARRLDVDRLLRYFADRQLFDNGETRGFNKQRLDQHRDDRDEFSAPVHEALYHLWRESGESLVRSRLDSSASGTRALEARFLTHLLEHDYDIFETLRVAS
jgi:hypothetical protein